MSVSSSRVVVHMAASLDGFIARKDGRVDWMDVSDKYPDGEAMSEDFIKDFLEGIDCYVMGSGSYEVALKFDQQGKGWAYGDKPVYVLSSRELEINRDTVSVHNVDIEKFIIEQLRPNYSSIWVVGGCELCTRCVNLGLADEINYVILPVLIGDGVPFFDGLNDDVHLHLKDQKAYTNGMVELHYELRKEQAQ